MIDTTTWAVLGLTLTLIGLLASVLVWRRRGPAAGLRALQLAFREASEVPDAPGEGPGEKLTGPVSPTRTGR